MAESDDEASSKERQLKVVILGDGTTGKTSIATRYSQNHFDKTYQQTLGIDYFMKRIILPGDVHVTMQVRDIGGQTIGGQMLDNYIYGAHAVLFVYDITNYSSFENLEDWLAVVKRVTLHGEASEPAKLPHLALIGNKIDLDHMRTVRKERHVKFAKEHNMSSHFLSAKTDDLINNCFLKIAANVLKIRLSNVDLERASTVVKADIVHTESDSPPSQRRITKVKTKSTFCVLQ